MTTRHVYEKKKTELYLNIGKKHCKDIVNSRQRRRKRKRYDTVYIEMFKCKVLCNETLYTQMRRRQ